MATKAASSPSKPCSKKIRTLIVDDHPILRQGLMKMLEGEEAIEVCGEAASAKEALKAIESCQPDLAIVDISLEGTNGIELIKNIRARFSSVDCLVLSMHDESLYAERALRAGAKGYIMKQEASERIVTAIRQVSEGKIYVSEKIGSRIMENIASGRSGAGSSPLDLLTDRELEVFELIGRGIGTRAIAQQLHLSVKTIEAHRSHIKDKLNLKSGVELVQRAIQWVQSGKAS